jgi:hypothetical protein
MATLKDAETARALHSKRLARAGAHAIGIERLDDTGSRDSWAVVAHIDPGASVRIPDTVVVGRGAGRIRVPVRLAESEHYELE